MSDKSELEKKFTEQYNETVVLINEQLSIAGAALSKAEEISIEYGVPFFANLSPLGQSFVPPSFREKFEGIDEEFVSEITGAYNKYEAGVGYDGWQHSDVC